MALCLCAFAAPVALAADCARAGGPLRLTVIDLQSDFERAEEPLARARAAAALGAAWLKLDRQDDAARALEQALAGPLPARERAAVQMDLGVLALTQRRHADADAAWRAAAALAPGDAEVTLAAELNRLRLPDVAEPAAPAQAAERPATMQDSQRVPTQAAQRLARLQAALVRSAQLTDAPTRTRHVLHIAAQLAALGPEAQPLAQQTYEQGRLLAQRAGAPRLAAEAYEGLAALAELDGRPEEALRLVEQGIAQARRVDARERLMQLEGRAGRLALGLGDPERALAAYRRAVEHVEAVRGDIPVQYQDGRSSFRDTLEPLYLGLTDLLLRRSETAPAAERPALLRQARDTVELIKQTELEDWLRNRCGVEANRSAWVAPAGSALLHPIILADRLELLVETPAGLERRSTPVPGEQLREEVLDFVAALRERRPLQARAEWLYQALVQPLEPVLAAQGIKTLVIVPDGVLRLLPFAALHDGRGWLLQRYALATVPGLSLRPAPRPAGAAGVRVAGAGQAAGGAGGAGDAGAATSSGFSLAGWLGSAKAASPSQALWAGMSDPGPVIERLPKGLVQSMLEPAGASRQPAAANTAGSAAGTALASTDAVARSSALREALALPGVRQEIDALAKVLPGTVLLDRGFTLQALKAQMRATAPPIVHLASHGVFGESAEATFIMTYDELLTLDGLQALLREGRPRDAPIELLTLSACQTAEGDDRAPLGMSGTALKARARSVLGTLWPVADDAAQQAMERFYRDFAAGRLSRAAALREAQLALLAQPKMAHPFFWAPFILIGDWQ